MVWCVIGYTITIHVNKGVLVQFNPLILNGSEPAYAKWRDNKLRAYDNGLHTKPVELDSIDLREHHLSNITNACKQFNYVIYRLEDPAKGDKSFVRMLGKKLGLHRLDGNLCSDEDNISSIQVMQTGRQTGYIPYSDKQLTWHTDGYYNDEARTIRAMILHCVRSAAQGGENLMLDHEMAYIQLREAEPKFIEAFAQLDVLTIPPNIEDGVEIRGAQSGPVFSLDGVTQSLHMRFSARTRNIEWKQDVLTQEALACMRELLDGNNPYVITCRMESGEGIIANNVLHNRTAFVDAEDLQNKRLLYRARYYDRVKPVEIE